MAEAVGGAARLQRANSPCGVIAAVRSRPRGAILFAWALARGESLSPPRAAGRRRSRRAGAHHRAAPDDRRRTGLARRITPKDHVLMTRVEPMPGARRSAPKPIPSCSRSSTISSCRSPSRWASRCRTPPIRSISRSGSTFPAPCSTARAASSPTPRTCRCIWARWIARSRRSSATIRGAFAPATCSRSTRPTTAAPILPDITVCTPVFDERGADDPVLDRLARPSRRYRRNGARIDVPARDVDPGGGRLYRQFPPRRARPLPRARTL